MSALKLNSVNEENKKGGVPENGRRKFLTIRCWEANGFKAFRNQAHCGEITPAKHRILRHLVPFLSPTFIPYPFHLHSLFTLFTLLSFQEKMGATPGGVEEEKSL